MSMYDPVFTTVSSDTTQIRGVTDYISLVHPQDHPLFSYFGLADPGDRKWNLNGWPNTKVEWLEDERRARTDALDGSISSTATTITVDDASVFYRDVIEIDSEWMAVTDRDVSAQTLTVVRAVGGTSAATHADEATVTRKTSANLEGVDTDSVSFMARTAPHNYVQEFIRGIQVSDRARIQSNYGLEDEYVYQATKELQDAMEDLERALLYGKRQQAAAGTPSMMRGLEDWINQSGANTVDAGGAVTQDDFDEAMRLAYEDGGNPTVAIISPSNMKVVKNFYDNSSFLRVPRNETQVGMEVQSIVGPYGEVSLLMNRWQPDSSIWLLDEEHFGILAFQDFYTEELGRTGTYEKGQLSGTFTNICRHADKVHAGIINIS